MTRRVVALTVVLVLAGCSGFAADSSDERTRLTPLDVPTTAADDRYVAPGVTAARLVDPGTLQRAHVTELSNTSHTFRERVTRRYPNGTVRSQYTTVVRRNGSRVRYQYDQRATSGRTARSVDTWANGRVIYTATTTGNGTTYTVENVTTASRRVPLETTDYATSLGRVFGLLSLTVDERVRGDDGVRYRLVTAEPRDVPPLRNASFEGYVTPDGVLTEYTVTYRVERDGRPVDVTVRVTVDELGTTTVPRPGWSRNATRERARDAQPSATSTAPVSSIVTRYPL